MNNCAASSDFDETSSVLPMHLGAEINHAQVGSISQSSNRTQLLRSAARRLRSTKRLTRSSTVLRRLPSSVIAGANDTGQPNCAIASLRTLLTSDLPWEELVHMSFQPELLDRKLRRIRAELSREATIARLTSTRTSPSGAAAARAVLRASGSFSKSLDSSLAQDCRAALPGRRYFIANYSP